MTAVHLPGHKNISLATYDSIEYDEDEVRIRTGDEETVYTRNINKATKTTGLYVETPKNARLHQKPAPINEADLTKISEDVAYILAENRASLATASALVQLIFSTPYNLRLYVRSTGASEHQLSMLLQQISGIIE